jgi:hypothetical protein
MNLHYLILTSGNDLQESAVADLVRSRTGARLVRVEVPRKASAKLEPDAVCVRADRPDELYCMLASASRACCVAVSAPSVAPTLEFLAEHPGTANDFALIICTATPREGSQQSAVGTLAKLASMGVDPTRIGVVYTRTPRDASVEQTFKQLAGYLANGPFTAICREAVLKDSTAFERARELQLPIADVLSGQVRFESALEGARHAGEPEELLHALARKLLAQRALTGCRVDIDKALDMLRVPHIPQQELPPAVSVTSTPPQPHAVVLDGGVALDVTSPPHSEPLPA